MVLERDIRGCILLMIQIKFGPTSAFTFGRTALSCFYILELFFFVSNEFRQLFERTRYVKIKNTFDVKQRSEHG